MKRLITLLIYGFFLNLSLAQKSIFLSTAPSLPVIDGVVEDSVWRLATEISDFQTALPYYNLTPQQSTLVRILQTTEGLAVAARCESPAVRADGSVRDQTGSADYFSVGLDTWNDDQNAFVFAVTAFGQKLESRLYSGSAETGYDAYWKAATHLEAGAWTVEMFIPWTALRFPVRGPQRWGLQFTRFDRTSGETSTWSPDDPLVEDKVLQYGELALEEKMERKRRLGVSILGSGEFYREKIDIFDYAPQNGFRIQSGIDGRFGLNSATTFDFTLLPAMNILEAQPGWGILGLIFDQNNLPRPRQFDTEENGIFLKSNNYNANPYLSSEYIRSKLDIKPGQYFFSTPFPTPLSDVKFSTRLRNNFSLGVSNRIMSRLDYSISDASGNIVLNEKYKYRPNVNQIFVEKTLPNNSWINLSNGHWYGGEGLTANSTALTFQLRNRSNRLQAAGNLRHIAQAVDSGGLFSVVDGYAGIEAVNGKWTGGITYGSHLGLYPGFPLDPYGFFNSSLQTQTLGGYISRRNYQPARKAFLNTALTLFSDLSWYNTSGYFQTSQIGLRGNALTQNFRRWEFSLALSPLKEKQALYFNQLIFYRDLPESVSYTVSHSTDLRKKCTFNISAGGKWHLGSDLFHQWINVRPRWVILPEYIFETYHLIQFENRLIREISHEGNFSLAEEFDRFGQSHGVRYTWQPSTQWQYFMDFGISHQLTLNQKAYTLQGLPKGEPFPYSFNNALRNQFSGEFKISLQWNFNSMSQLRFSGQTGWGQIPRDSIRVPGLFIIPDYFRKSNTHFSLAWIYNWQNR